MKIIDYRDICLACLNRSNTWFCSKYHDTLFRAVKVCSKNPINKDTTQNKQKSDNMNRLEELANMSVDSGNFLKFDNGYAFLFQLPTLDQEFPEVEKTYEGKKAGSKIQWRIILKGIKIMKPVVVDYKREVNPEKCSKIENQEVDKVYTLELGKKATKKLSKYILDNGIKTSNILKFWRTGESSQTIYNFVTESSKPSME